MESIFSTNLIIYFLISLLGAAVGITSLILRYQRLKKGNIVFRRRYYWFCNIFLLANPVIVILFNTGTYYKPAQTSAVLAIVMSFIVTIRYISETITFDSDGILSRNSVFVKTFYPYSAIVSKDIYTQKHTNRRNHRNYSVYVDFFEIIVRQENRPERKKISMEIDSYNYEEFMRMLDKKCPQLNHSNQPPLRNHHSVNFYGG
ncbi:MAG: hypothetical protein UH080_06520 [Ruminococcus sp.]|nr:hypothetical protein [Ruminococcus sp.]